ncbi:S8 family peptidase [Sinimarinibacterium sp. CAU 1509]|uniref:S8 family peptidase n=1 Tax=Sinimarinibacterium sp. CAU 1509 TaxID=2562283 RepID=UPI0010AC7DE3|nr:S8 family peptidase [Sinimarinibacterium sp. CAU 1509]TJY62894.1 S8 family peptidase [Sinimarinibacterium sp. CAU 1509]
MNRIKRLTLRLGMVLVAGLMGVTSVQAAPQPIANQYIVELNAPAPGSANARLSLPELTQSVLALVGGGQVIAQYQHVLRGFAARLTPAQAEALARLPLVKHIEQDQMMAAVATQSGSTWGLDRIDQTDLPLDNLYSYPTSAGQGVNVYVIDTGLNAAHSEFSGRVGVGRNFAANSGGLLCNLLGIGCKTDATNTTDCNGHGTHVTGTAAGSVYGVAKKATVHPVRVLGCNGSGSNSGVIAGVDWVAANAQLPAVANMSLGGGDSAALDAAVQNAVASGVVFVVAAGNDNVDACSGSPNKVPEAITVGATTNADARASYSNFGSCVDLFAPGSNITSAWYDSNTATNTISGTSMASPHVAGAAALVLGANPSATPTQVTDAIVGSASLGKLSSIGSGSPNALLYVVH